MFFVALVGAAPSARAARLDVHCPAGGDLNACVAEACANPEGGNVFLEAGVYDANLNTAVNIEAGKFPPDPAVSHGLCPGGVSIIGQGTDLTYLVSQGPNTVVFANGQSQNFPIALSVGSNFGEMTGPAEIRDLTVRCEAAPTACPQFGVGNIGSLHSGSVVNVRVEGFFRAIRLATHNGLAENNELIGVGPNATLGRGLFIVTAAGIRYPNMRISHNHASGFWRGLAIDGFQDVTVSHNTFLDSFQGMLVQNILGPLEVSHNKMEAADVGILSILITGDPESEGTEAIYAHNQTCGAAAGIIVDTNTETVFRKNLFLGTPADSGVVVATEDPGADRMTLEGNIALPKSRCDF